MVVTPLLRQVTVTGALMEMLPALPSSWKVEGPLLLLRMRMWLALASAPDPVTRTTPSLAVVLLVSRFTVPDNELSPLRINVPGPLLVKPFVPASGAEIVAMLVTAMDGEVADPLSR